MTNNDRYKQTIMGKVLHLNEKYETSGRPPNEKLPVRKFDWDFSKTQNHWLDNSAFKTHVLNTISLMLPAAERFFVDTVKKFAKDVKDDSLREAAKGFYGQEIQHYLAHDKTLQMLRDQGYEIDSFLEVYQKFGYDFWHSLLGDKIGLSATAGFEHYTALVAEIGLTSGILDRSSGEMKRLFEWHAAEEIEHKSVVFDVLNEIDDNYFLRLAGITISSIIFYPFLFWGTFRLVAQDGLLFEPKTWKDFLEIFFTKEKFLVRAAEMAAEYLYPDFHPWDKNNSHLADNIFRKYEEQRTKKAEPS